MFNINYKRLNRKIRLSARKEVMSGPINNTKRFFSISKKNYMYQKTKKFKAISEYFWEYITKISLLKWNNKRFYFNSQKNQSQVYKFSFEKFNKIESIEISKESKDFLNSNFKHYQIIEKKDFIVKDNENNQYDYVEIYALQVTHTGLFKLPNNNLVVTKEFEKGLNIGSVGIKFEMKKNEYENIIKNKQLNWDKGKQEKIINFINNNQWSYYDLNANKVIYDEIKYSFIDNMIQKIDE